MFERGLAYRAEAPVQWCPVDQTVLANEQVIDGHCERCGSLVEQRNLEQWFFKITDYADRLLDDFATLEILARARGDDAAELDRPLRGRRGHLPLRGARPRLPRLHDPARHPVRRHRSSSSRPSTRTSTGSPPAPSTRRRCAPTSPRLARESTEDRGAEDREKTGVPLGRTVTNPVNGEEIPMFVADYVLMDYGTGAIMAVPAHDERDFDFANAFDLPIRQC